MRKVQVSPQGAVILVGRQPIIEYLGLFTILERAGIFRSFARSVSKALMASVRSRFVGKSF
jgi:hypothetical protein